MSSHEIAPSRVIHGAAGARYRPWLEVHALFGLDVPLWGHRDEAWFHRAVPVVDGTARVGGAVAFSPGRLAGALGEPPAPLRECDFALDAATARVVVEALVAGWRPTLLRQPELGTVSLPDESAAAFRRRLIAGLAPLVRAGELAGASGAAALARVADGVERRPLGRDELAVKRVTIGVVWYPSGTTPGEDGDDLMISGRAAACR